MTTSGTGTGSACVPATGRAPCGVALLPALGSAEIPGTQGISEHRAMVLSAGSSFSPTPMFCPLLCHGHLGWAEPAWLEVSWSGRVGDGVKWILS